jgi:alginate O-acetyltransferase complex protein AlgI
MFGFSFPENFNYPYVAASVRDFWRRWHITLSTWFRDYVYIPLGGSRGSEARTWRNLLVVFVTCGLWHGASWNFVVWGLFHGVFISLERTRLGSWLERCPAAVQHAYLLLVVMLGWVLFRCESMAHAGSYLAALVPHQSESVRSFREYMLPDAMVMMLVGVALSTPIVPWLRSRVERLTGAPRAAGELAWLASILAIMALSVGHLVSGSYNPFIYFRF